MSDVYRVVVTRENYDGEDANIDTLFEIAGPARTVGNVGPAALANLLEELVRAAGAATDGPVPAAGWAAPVEAPAGPKRTRRTKAQMQADNAAAAAPDPTPLPTDGTAVAAQTVPETAVPPAPFNPFNQ